MMSIQQALIWASAQFASTTAKLDAEVLLAACLDRNRTYLYTWPEVLLSSDQETQWRTWVQRRVCGEPVAYIIGKREFWSLELEVNASTLIPRPDTELLVEFLLSGITNPQVASVDILDLGTGTGAIAIALAKALPNSRICATDWNADAVALAERNRLTYQCGNMRCLQSNWYDKVDGRFDWIVSNPPYIAADDPHLRLGDLRFEPRGALVAEQNGLADLHRIISGAPQFLKSGGRILVEHGWQQHQPVQQRLVAVGFDEVFTARDYADHPRISGGRWSMFKK